MAKKNIFILLIILNLISLILSEEPIYETKTIGDMKSSFFNSLGEGFYYLGSEIIPKGYNIIAFSDLDGDGFTDIITYIENDTFFDFHGYIYDKEDLKFKSDVQLFYVDKRKEKNININSIRNLYVGGLSGQSKTCYLASFNTKNPYELLHYAKCGEEYTEAQIIEGITSNILIMNRNADYQSQILYKDGDLLKICTLKKSYYECDSKNFITDSYRDYNISLTGGLAYVDIDGNCAPDVLLSYEKDNTRYIEIFLYDRKKEEYVSKQNLTIGLSDYYGPFAISILEKKTDRAPQVDILVPNLNENKILGFENILYKGYKWDKNFCQENDNSDLIDKIEFNIKNYSLFDKDKVPEQAKLDNSSITVIRTGDFDFSSKPGILVVQNYNEKSNISLYKKDGKEFSLFLQIKDSDIKVKPKSALFFDINESGSLGLIVQDAKYNSSHFFFNFRKNTFFIKAKLMNDKNKKLNSDINLGAYYRYIVTDRSGDRSMDISYQMVQTSDMNIPLPYSLCGIGETNNYIENFQVISGNYYKDDSKFEDPENEKNFMLYTPIIPNTQMKIYKFKNSNEKYEWYIDLIVEPTDSLIIIIIILIAVMFAILGVVIYLYVREVKEEQKEESKFKSWFA